MKNIKQPSCVLIGQDSLLLTCAQTLLSRSFLIKAIISPSSSVHAWARDRQIFCVNAIADIDWKSQRADYLFSIANEEIIPASVLQKIRQLAINYHDAPLPRYAGTHATAWAIANNETTHGISWHEITDKIDRGDVLKQITIPISPGETVLSLNLKCVERAIASFDELVGELLNHSYRRHAQGDAQRSYFSRAQKPPGNAWISWESSAEELERLWRATQFGHYRNQFSLTKTVVGNEALVIDTFKILSETSTQPPGTVLDINDNAWVIATTTKNIAVTLSGQLPGGPIKLTDLALRNDIRQGIQLRSPALAEREAFQHHSQQFFLDEAWWVNALLKFEATTLPDATPEINLQALPESVANQCLNFSENANDASIVMLAAWLAYLHRSTGQTQIGVCISSQRDTIPDPLSPFFAQYLPLSINLNPQHSFSQLTDTVRSLCADLLEHETYLNDIWHRYPELAQLTPPELQATRVRSDNCVSETGSAQCTLPTSFISLLKDCLQHPECPVAALDWVTPQERQTLLVDWNNTDCPYSAEQTIHGMFEAQVHKTPHHCALIAQDVRLTYFGLNQQANQLAHFLITQFSIQPDQVIAVCLERSHGMSIALLGILKSGAAYVPLDTDYPAKRIAHIVDETKARVVITTGQHASKLRSNAGIDWSVTTLLVLDDPALWEALLPCSINNPAVAVQSQNLAYVLYTSGTTGTPKGIQIEHRSIVNRLCWMNRAYPLQETDRVLQKTPYVFDVSVWELFWAIWSGATIVFAKPGGHREPAYLAQLIHAESVSIIHFTPTMLTGFVQALETQSSQLTTLRHVFCSGETLHASAVDQVMALLPAIRMHNLYGPTEAAIDVLSYDCISGQPVYIGRPIANTRVYVLDEQNRIVPVGVSGELHIAGDGVARGYLHQDALTAQKFILNPYQTDQDKQAGRYERLYKTGDLARWLPGGNLDYLGRNDQQIKLRGYRIEPGEIEHVLQRNPAIKQCAVEVVDNQLLAYYTATQPIDTDRIKSYLAEFLPGYMIPGQFIFQTQLPLSISGKIDRKSLPRPAASRVANFAPPENATQAAMAQAFSAVLGLEPHQISLNDDFFSLGGDSILAIRLVSRLNALFQHRLQVKDVLQLKTIRALSAIIEQSESPSPPSAASYKPFELIEIGAYQDLLNENQIEDIYPASRLQIGMLLESSFNAHGTYHDVFYYTINVPFEQARFLDVWQALANRHALLRARFLLSEQNGLNVVIFKQAQLDFRHFPDHPVQELIDAERLNNFSHTEECLFRLIANQRADNFDLIFSFHHAIVDGWSVASLINEFVQAYTRNQPIWPEPSEQEQREQQERDQPSLSYGEFVRDELRRLDDQASLAFWKTYLEGSEPAQARWKFDDVATSPDSLFSHSFLLTSDEAKQAKRLAREQAISVDCVFLYAYLKTLSFFLNSDDITIGVVFNNRLEKIGGDVLIGLFLNVLPFRLQLNPANSMQEALSETFTTKIKLYGHKHIPYAVLKSTFNRKLYEFGFNFIHFHDLKKSEKFIEARGGFERASIPFLLEVTQADTFKVELRAHDNYISQEYLNYFGHYLKLIFQNILQNKNTLSLDAQDYQKMAIDWNATRKSYPRKKTLHQLFEEQVERTPDAIALVYEETRLTYQELNQQSNQLAHYLLTQYLVQPDDLIALCLKRNELIVVAMLAVLKSGAAYVPIDPDYPEERITCILRDTQTRVVLSSGIYQHKFDANSFPYSVVVLDDSFNQTQFQLQSILTPITPVTSNHLAYVTYTSGTTGKPNGVMIEHQGVVNLIFAIIEIHSLNKNKHLALYSNYVFDAFPYELFPALSLGCQVFILPNPVRHDLQSLSAYFIAHAIQFSFIPSSLVNDFIETYSGDKLEKIYAGGERIVLSPHIDMNKLSHELFNEYGMTEVTVCTTYKKVTSDNGHCNTNIIGRPIANSTCYVFNENGLLAPMGATGELFIGGAGLARGYVNNPDLTSKKFVQNPLQTADEKKQGIHARLYKTGDLVRWLSDGNLEFIARNDSQIKIWGYRIEPGEIEILLNEHPAIKQSVVLQAPDGLDSSKLSNHLIAYYIKKPYCETVVENCDNKSLRTYLEKQLPRYMLPQYFVPVEKLPLTINGKIDQSALPQPIFSLSDDYVPPQNMKEHKMCALFAHALGMPEEKIGVTDDFFSQLGGSSIEAIKLMAQINKTFQTNLHMRFIVTDGTIKKLLEMMG